MCVSLKSQSEPEPEVHITTYSVHVCVYDMCIPGTVRLHDYLQERAVVRDLISEARFENFSVARKIAHVQLLS